MSHLHKNRNAQINDNVPDLEKERTPDETAKALANATGITEVRDHGRDVDAVDVDSKEVETEPEEDDEDGDNDDLTKAEIMSALDERQIEYDAKAKKADLLALLNQ